MYGIHAVDTSYMRWVRIHAVGTDFLILFTFFLILPTVYLPYLLLKKVRKSANNFSVRIFLRIGNVTTASCLCDWGIRDRSFFMGRGGPVEKRGGHGFLPMA